VSVDEIPPLVVLRAPKPDALRALMAATLHPTPLHVVTVAYALQTRAQSQKRLYHRPPSGAMGNGF
jgi:hypothetical protein